jgi:hypothetical protein
LKELTNSDVHLMLVKSLKMLKREAAVTDVCVQPGGGAVTAKLNGKEVTFRSTTLGLISAVLSNAPLKPDPEEDQATDQTEDSGSAGD